VALSSGTANWELLHAERSSTMPYHFEVVEAVCGGCGLCVERASENIAMSNGSGFAQVVKQPENGEQEDACLEASDYCPSGGLLASDADSRSAD
jgi:ferredoxin